MCILSFGNATSWATGQTPPEQLSQYQQSQSQLSQNSSSASTKIFSAKYFADSLPQTSWDMIARLPGFTFSAGDDNVRGYSGSAGNVLIDGQRPASKYQDLESLLRRIPARTVAGIELIRGNAPGIDMQGHLIVANIVRIQAASTEVRVDSGVYLVDELGLFPAAKVEATRSWDDKRLEGTVGYSNTQDDDSGDGSQRQTSVDGVPQMQASTTQEEIKTVYQATVGYEQDLFGGGLRLNANYWTEDKSYVEDIENILPESFFSLVDEHKDTQLIELGGSYEKVFESGTQLSLVAIQQSESEKRRNYEKSPLDFTSFFQNNDSGETILRGTVQQTHSATTRFEWGAELAYNFLESDTESAENGEPVVLPGADVRVEEKRAEPFFKVNWDLHPHFTLEAGGAIEVSQISQSGDAHLSKSLSYFKPQVQLAWTPSTSDQLRLQLDRQVGQLDFGDFVSSAEFSTGTINAGNAELVPSSSWDFTATWEHQFLAETTSVLTLHHARISDVVDVVPIYVTDPDSGETEVFDGPGNIGTGWLNEAELGLNLRLARWGIEGGLIKASLIYRDSSVTDPTTQQKRAISDYVQPWEGNIEWFHDIPEHRFRWGANVSLSEQSKSYRLDETRVESERGWLGMFAEYNPSDQWSIRLEAQNLTGREVRLERTIYDGPRNTGDIESFKVQSVKTYPYLFLQVTWSLSS